MTLPWRTYSSYISEKYGRKLYRVGVDAGFSCPNRSPDRSGGCTYCDGSGAVAVYQREDEKGWILRDDLFTARMKSIDEQVERGLEFIRRRYRADYAALYLQAWSNTFDTPEHLKAVYDHVLSLADFREFIVSTRPDLLGEEVCRLLSSYITPRRDVWVEVGLQSASDRTLERVNRGHNAATWLDAVRRARSFGLRVTAHIMLMPSYDTPDDIMRSVEMVNESGAEAIKIHNIHITHSTALERNYLENGCFSTSSFRRHVALLSMVISHLRRDVIVERIVTETPRARLVYPVSFPDKRDLIEALAAYMNERGLFQGCLLPEDKFGV